MYTFKIAGYVYAGARRGRSFAGFRGVPIAVRAQRRGFKRLVKYCGRYAATRPVVLAYTPGEHSFHAATKSIVPETLDAARDADMRDIGRMQKIDTAQRDKIAAALKALQDAIIALRAACWPSQRDETAPEQPAGGYRSGRRNYSHWR